MGATHTRYCVGCEKSQKTVSLGLARQIGYVLFLAAVTFTASAEQANRAKRNDHRSKGAPVATTQQSAATEFTYPKLIDITASTGITFQHVSSPEQKYIIESMSGGVALIDYDRDGWPDIYFTNAYTVDMALHGKKAGSALYHNNHDGTFTDVTDKAGVGDPCWAMGAVVGDYNNDGWPDLLVTCFGGVKGEHADALRELTTATKLKPDDVAVHWRLAQLYRTMGRKNEAQMEFEKTKTLTRAADESLASKLNRTRSQSETQAPH